MWYLFYPEEHTLSRYTIRFEDSRKDENHRWSEIKLSTTANLARYLDAWARDARAEAGLEEAMKP